MTNGTRCRMTRQHFELVADLLAEIGDTLDLRHDQRRAVAKLGADALAGTNGAFRRDTFQARATFGPLLWSVGENTPGYLPDGDGGGATFATRAEATRYALTLVAELREDGYRVSGSARVGLWEATNGSLRDLGRVVEVLDLASLL